MKGAAIELALRGVTVNNIQPGPTTTDMTKEHTRTRIAVHPAGPDGQDAREVAGQVTYLASEEAGFTGASVTIDGAYSA